MEEFEKKIKKAKKGTSKTGWFFLVIAIILLAIGMLQTAPDKETMAEFDGLYGSEYYKADVLYLIGPFAEYTENDVVVENVYTALTADDMYILVKTGRTTDIPILGEDVTEENIDSIEPTTIYGYGELLPSDIEGYLVEFWNQVYEEEIFTTENYIEYFGYYFLDTTNQGEGAQVACYIFATIFGVLAIVALLGKRKTNKNTENYLKTLEEDGKLEAIKNEYSKETVESYKKLNLELTENYIINYAPQLVIVPFADVVNVYRSNMIDGVYQPFRYIALETKNNEKYYVAQKPLDAKNPQFEEALEKIKSKVKQGGI